MVTRKVIETVQQHRERNLPLFLLVFNLGFGQTAIPYQRGQRVAGSSGWTFRKRFEMGFDMLTAFSAAPLRLVSLVGGLIGLFGLVFGLVTIIRALLGDVPIEGWASLMVVTSLMGGTILVAIAVLGEYVWRTLDEVRDRPRFLERSYVEVSPEEGAAGSATAEQDADPH
jgi:dolichol-phosphate mannosyltransferase